MLPLETLDPLTALDELDLFFWAFLNWTKALSISLASLAALGEASLELCQKRNNNLS